MPNSTLKTVPHSSTNSPFDYAVVGAGPAGIVTSLELADAGFRVALIDSGVRRPNPTIQQLGDAHAVTSRHAPMELCTRRQLGGATVIWGGRCVPYDPIDFETREFVGAAEWPVGYRDIKPYFDRAAEYFVCGDARFSTHEIDEIRTKTLTPLLADGDVKSSDLERWSLPTNFGREYGSRLSSHPNITLFLGRTCVEVKTDESGGLVTGLRLRDSLTGQESLVRPKRTILAMGGLETTRLLLASNRAAPAGLGNQSGVLGRYYMGHISGSVARIRLAGEWRKTQYAFLRDRAGVYLRQRFTLSAEAQTSNRINNTAAWLVNQSVANARHGNGVLSFAYLALSSKFGKYFASEAIRRAVIAGGEGSTKLQHWRNIASQPLRTAAFIPTFGVKRFLLRRRIPGFFQPSIANEYHLHYHGEQIPNFESKVVLSDEKDRLGMPKIDVDLRFSQQDVDSVIRFHQVLDASLRERNAGQLVYTEEDLNAAIWEQASDGYHQAGTTRMSNAASGGVVDADLRVFGTSNLYVASSSVFVTSGQANSTFMIVAFALRLSDHLRSLSN